MKKKMLKLPKRICIVRIAALGDVTLTLPLVQTLQANIPDCEITWIICKPFYPLVEALPNVNFVVIDRPYTPLDYWRLYKRLQGMQFDVVLGIQSSFRANLIYPLISAPLKIGYDSFRARDAQQLFINQKITPKKQHLLETFLSFAEALGINNLITESNLPVASEALAWVKTQLPEGPLLVINPSASKPERNWFVKYYAEVIREAVKNWKVNVVLTGGFTKQEAAIAEAISREASVPIINLVGKTDLKQLVAILSCADVLLAPDTGPAHIANAVGTPVVGLFAVAPPELSSAYHSKHLVVNKYPEAVKLIMKKDPDKIPWATRVHSQKAMELIKPKDVLQKLAIIFDK